MEIAIRLFVLLNNLVPKKKKKIVFKSIPDFVGNSLALFEYIDKNHKDEYEIIWLTSKKENENRAEKKYYVKSIKGIYEYMTSKYIVTTHGDICRTKSKNQIYIGLWHGIPLKKIGYLGKEVQFMESKNYNSSGFKIATSELTRMLISSSFNERADRVKITGQPRNDYLYKNFDFKKIGIDVKKYNKIISYIPTFRENIYDEGKTDGRKIKNDNFFRIDGYNHDDFLNYLENNNLLFLLKLHPFEEHILKNIKETENFKVLKSKILSERNIDINQILSRTDLMISDYSSVYIDYLILNRPLFFVIPDYEEYSKNRDGFTLEPFKEWIPGEKILTLDKLYNKMDEFLKGKDNYKNERKKINSILNKYSDDKNSERVFKKIIEKGNYNEKN